MLRLGLVDVDDGRLDRHAGQLGGDPVEEALAEVGQHDPVGRREVGGHAAGGAAGAGAELEHVGAGQHGGQRPGHAVAEDGADEVAGLEGLPEAAAALGDDLPGVDPPGDEVLQVGVEQLEPAEGALEARRGHQRRRLGPVRAVLPRSGGPRRPGRRAGRRPARAPRPAGRSAGRRARGGRRAPAATRSSRLLGQQTPPSSIRQKREAALRGPGEMCRFGPAWVGSEPGEDFGGVAVGREDR